MAERDRPHIIIRTPAQAEAYRRPPRNMSGKPTPSPANRAAHGQRLRTELEDAEREGTRRREQGLQIEGAIPGVHVVFESFPGIELAFERLDPRQGKLHPELLSVHEVVVNGETVEQATVFIPEGKLGYFLRRIDQYLSTATEDKPRNRDLIDRKHSGPRLMAVLS